MEQTDDPQYIGSAENDTVLAYLRDRSAHGDLASALWDAAATLGDVQSFSPDLTSYRYVALATRGVIFAFASGMSDVSLRLDTEFKQRALICGAIDLPEAGADWVSIAIFRNDWPDPDLRFWVRKAYLHGRG